jgi:peptidyl carrier protein
MSTPDLTAAVTRIWTDVLGLSGADDAGTFFDLRGDSISAIRLVARLEDELGVVLDVADIFEEDPDLAGLVRDVAARAS